MGYALSDPRAIDEDRRRLLREQYERARVALIERKVHRARTSCKRARAAILLIGPRESDPVLAELLDRTRNLASALGGRRDAQVMIRTIERLASRESGCHAGMVVARLGLSVGPPAEVAWDDLTEQAGRLGELVGQIEASDASICELAGRGYARARRRRPKAADAPAEEFHRWRSATKTHWYQTRILRPLSAATLGSRARELRTLSDWQGKHHDLAVLLDRLAEHRGEDVIDRMIAAGVERQHVLARKSLRLGKRLFSEGQSSFVASLEQLRRAWRKAW